MAANTFGASRRKTDGVTYESIVREVQRGEFKPVYYLMGEESYYIDRIADFIVEKALTPEEREFNMITLYGASTNIETVITSARTFPMGAARMLIRVNEAQGLQHIEKLEFYLKQPQPSTILILCHKNGVLDRRKKVASLIAKQGVLFESKKLYDNQLPTFISGYLRRKGKAISQDAASLMAEHIGSDLNRIASELDKLCISLGETVKSVTKDDIADNIGISKEFNNFELTDAIATRNAEKVFAIVKYFETKPPSFALQATLATIYKFFSNLMLAHYSPDKSERGIAAWLGMQDWQIRKNVLPALRNYSGMKAYNILMKIQEVDARSKGMGSKATPDGDLLKEVMTYILL